MIGSPATGHSVADVLRAPIAADGTVGPWQALTPLDAPLSVHSVDSFGGALLVARGHVLETPIVNGRVYSVGGSIQDLSCLGEVDVGLLQ